MARVSSASQADRPGSAAVSRRTGASGVNVARLGLALLLGAVLPGGSQAQQPERPVQPSAQDRGRALYETRCIACHERSVHQRESRRATDFASLRAEVARWSGTAGSEWRDEDVDAVTVFLNQRYYRFTCPPDVCRAPARAALPAGGS